MCHQSLLSHLGMGTVGKERSQLLVCYRAGNETGIGFEG